MPANRPTSSELVQAMQEFFKSDVLPLLGGPEKYHLQVALNALAIVGRELASGAQLDQAELRRLNELVGQTTSLEASIALLCARIRARKLTYRDPALIDHLLRSALGKMSIDNPKYATYLRVVAQADGRQNV